MYITSEVLEDLQKEHMLVFEHKSRSTPGSRFVLQSEVSSLWKFTLGWMSSLSCGRFFGLLGFLIRPSVSEAELSDLKWILFSNTSFSLHALFDEQLSNLSADMRWEKGTKQKNCWSIQEDKTKQIIYSR